MSNIIDTNYIIEFFKSKGNQVREIFESEEQVLELTNLNKFVVIGDLHGDFKSLSKILEKYSPEDWYLIFLGDYVDRGDYQIEVLTKVLELKLRYPRRVYLLRGNHESPLMNQMYGFIYELMFKLRSEELISDIYGKIVQIFSNMPYVAIVNNTYFLVHGGLAKGLSSIDDIKRLPKGDVNPDNEIAFQLVWNDPADDIEGFVENYFRGPGVYFYGPDVTQQFLTRYSLKMIIRAHEYTESGFKWNHNNRVLTIFSSGSGPYFFVNPKIFVFKDSKEHIVNIFE